MRKGASSADQLHDGGEVRGAQATYRQSGGAPLRHALVKLRPAAQPAKSQHGRRQTRHPTAPFPGQEPDSLQEGHAPQTVMSMHLACLLLQLT